MHASSLHPYTPISVAIYLDGLPTLITGMNICVSLFGQVLVPIAQLHQRVKASRRTKAACMFPHLQACQCSLCVVLLLYIDDI